jgi:hypothetical protein
MINPVTDLRPGFVNEIKNIIAQSRENAIRAVDFHRVQMYWHIGEKIVEEEQEGKERAEYGTYLIKGLSIELEPEFGTSFSVRQLELSRQFYRAYPIANALRSQLNWTQYRLLMRIEDKSKREYYIAEAIKNNWTARQMERQINSQLYERLLVSSDKKRVLAVAFVIIEIKTHKLTHQDIGQLQMYVNYYDRFQKLPEENPTIGILLAADKNNAVVKITLPEDNKTILATQYELYLPSEETLRIELVKEMLEIEGRVA